MKKLFLTIFLTAVSGAIHAQQNKQQVNPEHSTSGINLKESDTLLASEQPVVWQENTKNKSAASGTANLVSDTPAEVGISAKENRNLEVVNPENLPSARRNIREQ